MIVNNYLRTVCKIKSCSSVYAAFGFGSGTTANAEAILNGKSGVVKSHRTLINKEIKFDCRVVNNKSTVVLVGSILFTSGNVETVRRAIGSGSKFSLVEDNSAIACAAASDEEPALRPVNSSFTCDSNRLAVNCAVHRDRSRAFSPKELDSCTVLCCCECFCERFIDRLTDLCYSNSNRAGGNYSFFF